MEGSVWGLVYYIGFAIPIFLIYLIGFILSLVNRQRLGKAAIFAMAAFLVFILGGVISLISQTLYYFYLLRSGQYSYIGTYFTVIGVVRTLIEIIGFVLLLAALFVKRNETVPNEPPKVSFN